MPVDFFARRPHYIEHMLPVYKALNSSERGLFIVPDALADQDSWLMPGSLPHERGQSLNPMLVSAVSDLQVAHEVSPHRKFIFMEHGVGITYGAHQAYAGGGGMRTHVDLFLAPNEIVRAKTEKAIPGVKQVVVGTPKLDKFVSGARYQVPGEKPTVAISFHWDGKLVAPEASNAFEHYRRILPVLARWDEFKLIGHGHPRGIDEFIPTYQQLGIEVVRDFDEVMERADVYVCDNSSTIYEFCVTGKPVVIMNAPQYRKKIHWGIRFWDYTDIGPMIDEPEELLGAVLHALGKDEWKAERQKAVADLYPFLGCSAERAAAALKEFLYA